jgi:hypothetical protein
MNVRERWWWLQRPAPLPPSYGNYCPELSQNLLNGSRRLLQSAWKCKLAESDKPLERDDVRIPPSFGELHTAARSLPDSPLRERSSRLVERGTQSNGDDHPLQNDERKDDQRETTEYLKSCHRIAASADRA